MARKKTSTANRLYRARRGARLTDAQAQIYGPRLDALMEENNGDITPEQVVADAHTRASPLHEYFEWNNDSASQQWRLHQARMLLGSITVIVVGDKGEEEVRAFHNVVISTTDSAQRTYVGVERMLSEDELRQQVIARAMHEVQQWRQRYRQYQELSGIFRAIEKVGAKVK